MLLCFVLVPSFPEDLLLCLFSRTDPRVQGTGCVCVWCLELTLVPLVFQGRGTSFLSLGLFQHKLYCSIEIVPNF